MAGQSALRAENPYITQITATSWSSVANDGFTKISFKVTDASSGTATVTGLGTAGGAVGVGVTLTAGESLSYVAEPGAAIIITVVAAASCSVQIIAG